MNEKAFKIGCSTIMLVASFIALAMVLSGKPMRFSIVIICLIILVNVGYVIDSLIDLSNEKLFHLVIASIFDWMVQL